MTLGSSPLIEACELRRNNLDNTNPYPYINIGLQGVNSPTIRACLIEGGQFMSGGIAIWNSSQGLIEDNLIRDCGYGILCYSVGANPTIRGNTIRDNDIHPDTVYWGFGIACNGDNQPVIESNVIFGHWYGIAITGGAQPDLGHDAPQPGQSQGGNVLFGNGLGGEVYAIFNDTSNPISAEQNSYGQDVQDLAQVEDVIWHGADDPALGMVDFAPSFFGWIELGVAPAAPALELHGAAPNPFNPRTRLRFTLGEAAPVLVEVFDARGRRLRTLRLGVLEAGSHEVLFDGVGDRGQALPSGLYLYRVRAGDAQSTGRVQLVR
jgi:parallel beta-helix repeat protein